MKKRILIALALVIGLQMMPGPFLTMVPVAVAQDSVPAEDGQVGSTSFMFDLSAITNEKIEGSTRQSWIRRGVDYFFERAIGVMAAVIGSLAVLTMSFGGLRILLSGGDETGMQKGKQLVFYSLIGLGVTLMAYVLVTLVQLLIVSIYG